MKNIIKNSLFCCCLLLTTIAFAQKKVPYDIHKKYTAAELKADLTTLKEQLETVHTGLYTYTSKAELAATFAKIAASITQPMTSIEFYRLVAPLHLKIRNGHTMIIPSEDWDNHKETNIPIFPLEVYWAENKLWVLRNLSKESNIKEGLSIHKINGELATDVFNELVDNWTTDGYNRTLPAFVIQSDFGNWYANIKGTPSTFDIEIIDNNNNKERHQLTALLSKTLNQNSLAKYQLERVPWYRRYDDNLLKFKIDGNIATMKIPTFDVKSVKKNKQNFKKFYRQSFEKIEKAGVEHLIIDLRDNGGGDPIPTIELFAHLHDKPFTFYKEITVNSQKIPSKKLYPNATFFERLAHPLVLKKEKNVYKPNGLAKLFRVKGLETKKPNSPNYVGKVYVLTDPHSFSATGEMTSIIKNHHRAIFIGEEPGGNPNTNTSGFRSMLVLPNTNTRVIMPFWQWEMNVNFENTGHGVLPDYPIRPTVQEVIEGRDVVMEFTLDLIKKEGNKIVPK